MRRVLLIAAGVVVLMLAFWPSGLPGPSSWRLPANLHMPVLDGGGPRGRVPAARPAESGPVQEQPRPLVPKGVGVEDALLLGNASQVTRGAVITFEGHDYRPGEGVVLWVENTKSQIGRTVADRQGDFYGMGYGVPVDLPNGQHAAVAVGEESGRTGRARFVLQADPPYLKLDQETTKPGQQVQAQGGGFLPGEQLYLYLDSVAGQSLANAQAGPDGQLPPTPLSVPLAPKGDHFIVAVGASGRFPVRAPLYVLGFNPWIEMTNYTPQAEATFGFTGNDFAPGELLRIFLDQRRPDQPTGDPLVVVRVDGQGKVNAPDVLRLPATAVGEHTLVVMGAQTQQATLAEFEVMPFGPGLELTRYAGRVGTEVGFIGSYFAPGETLRAYLGKAGSGREVATFQADAQGTFQDAGRFVLPTDLGAGNVTLSVLGDRSLAPTSVVFTILPMEPGLELSQRWGDAGASLTFQGWGFAGNERVRVYQGDVGGTPVAEAQTDDDGNFSKAGPYQISPQAQGEVPFVVEGERSRGKAKTVYTVGVPPETPEESSEAATEPQAGAHE